MLGLFWGDPYANTFWYMKVISVFDEMMKLVGVKFAQGLSRDVVLPPKFCNVDFGKFWH